MHNAYGEILQFLVFKPYSLIVRRIEAVGAYLQQPRRGVGLGSSLFSHSNEATILPHLSNPPKILYPTCSRNGDRKSWRLFLPLQLRRHKKELLQTWKEARLR